MAYKLSRQWHRAGQFAFGPHRILRRVTIALLWPWFTGTDEYSCPHFHFGPLGIYF
jgi:hypothetical protein